MWKSPVENQNLSPIQWLTPVCTHLVQSRSILEDFWAVSLWSRFPREGNFARSIRMD
jgi:hypothetical protein